MGRPVEKLARRIQTSSPCWVLIFRCWKLILHIEYKHNFVFVKKLAGHKYKSRLAEKKSLLLNSVNGSLGNIKLFWGESKLYFFRGKENIFCMIFSSIFCNFVVVRTVEKLAGQVQIQVRRKIWLCIWFFGEILFLSEIVYQ